MTAFVVRGVPTSPHVTSDGGESGGVTDPVEVIQAAKQRTTRGILMSPRDTISAVTLADVRAARERIVKEIIRTPVVFSEAASRRAGGPVHLKLENLQRTGTFKVRGALSKVTSVTPEERQRGMVCASSGNHGLGVAYAASLLGVRCVVVLPQNANPHKRSLLQEIGAEVICYGETSDLCQQKAEEISQVRGYTLVHPFADAAIIAGQGTVGLEVLEDLPEVEEVYVPDRRWWVDFGHRRGH